MLINTTSPLRSVSSGYLYIWYAYESQELYGRVALKGMLRYTYRGYEVERNGEEFRRIY